MVTERDLIRSSSHTFCLKAGLSPMITTEGSSTRAKSRQDQTFKMSLYSQNFLTKA